MNRRLRSTATACAIVGALVVLAGCGGGDDSAADSITTTAPPLMTVAPTTTTIVTTTTTEAPSSLGSDSGGDDVPVGLTELATLPGVEVSALMRTGATERVLTIGGPFDDPLPAAPAGATVWCTASAPVSAGPYVVRVSPPGVGHAEGGVEGFELVSADLHDPANDAPVAATVTIGVDGRLFDGADAVLTLAAGGGAGAFRAELDDGSVVEGAFRCG